MMKSDWLVFTHPTIQLRFSYPAVTPQGHTVEKAEYPGDGSIRVHLTSLQAREVYFEVARYTQLSAQEGYSRHKLDLLKRYQADEFSITDLLEARLSDLPAYQYFLKWSDRERVVTFVPRQGALYRVIYDPRSPLNAQILETLEFLE